MVLADDIDTVPLALDLAPRGGVHADLHEYHPRQNEELRRWRLFVAPYYRWLVRTYGTRADSVTTVGEGIAREYRLRFGLRAGVVVNAPHFVDLEPAPVHGPLRLVHSGNAQRHRLDVILAAMDLVTVPMTLDLYLMPAGDGGRYLRDLQRRAGGHPGITFHDPVSPQELPATLNRYDVGVFWIPPFNANAARTLPNKLFDYVQARLAIAVGPTPEMARVVDEHRLGVVAEDFSVEAAARSLQALSRTQIATFKDNAHAASHALSFESEADVADALLTRLLS